MFAATWILMATWTPVMRPPSSMGRVGNCSDGACCLGPMSQVGRGTRGTRMTETCLSCITSGIESCMQSWGRWTRRDPLEYYDGFNVNIYTNSSPIASVDSYGLTACSCTKTDCSRVVGPTVYAGCTPICRIRCFNFMIHGGAPPPGQRNLPPVIPGKGLPGLPPICGKSKCSGCPALQVCSGLTWGPPTVNLILTTDAWTFAPAGGCGWMLLLSYDEYYYLNEYCYWKLCCAPSTMAHHLSNWRRNEDWF